MATITPTKTYAAGSGVGPDTNRIIYTYASIGNADTGASISIPEYQDRTISVSGTFGGATVTVQGSNDDSNWFTLNDDQGTALTIATSGQISLIAENPIYLRVISSGGTGTSLTAIIFGVKS